MIERPGYRLRPPDVERARSLGRELGLGATVAQVLLHRLLQQLLGARLLGGRIEDALLDRGVDHERVGDVVEEGLLLVLVGLSDLLEEAVHFAVLVGEILDGVHGASFCASVDEHAGCHSSAVTRPMPVLAPVTTHTRPVMSGPTVRPGA